MKPDNCQQALPQQHLPASDARLQPLQSLITHRSAMASDETNRRARQMALQSLPPLMLPQTGAIQYRSKGHLLIIGPEDSARLVGARIQGLSSITLLARGGITSQQEEHLEQAMQALPDAPCLYLPLISLEGWLGEFRLSLQSPQGTAINPAEGLIRQACFDLVLDLTPEGVMEQELTPPGYYHIAPESSHLHEALDELSGMVGEFEKPAYLSVNHDICAHSSRGQMGCTRCLDVCPADAISAHNNTFDHDWQIEINDQLCHGAGSCATACPTGALSFTTPTPASHLDQLRRLLESFHTAGGEGAVLLLHAGNTTPDLNILPGQVIPVALEEAAGIGAELWFSLLASGALMVAIQIDQQTPPSLRSLLSREVNVCGEILRALGHPAARISLIDGEQSNAQWRERITHLSHWLGLSATEPFGYTGKRQTLNEALDRLYQQGQGSDEPVPLPPGSPFGQVRINSASDTDGCTLCMSCVAVCPTQALRGGSVEQPQLAFLESDCVQCGLCERSCPEQVISLEPRFLPASGERCEVRILKQEDPFHCISCGKAFGTRSTITRIMQKLEAHPYFQGSAASRLQMCEDCRVKDSYRELVMDPEAQLRL